jgi:hypothetical protein
MAAWICMAPAFAASVDYSTFNQIINASDKPFTFSRSFQGITGGGIYPGVFGDVAFSFTGATQANIPTATKVKGKDVTSTQQYTLYNFAYTVDNTSSVYSELSGFGFSVDPDLAFKVTETYNEGQYGSSVLFRNVDSGSIANGLKVEFCLTAGSNCNGGSSKGFSPSADPLTGLFSLAFLGEPASITLSDFALRFQAIGPEGGSATGFPYQPPLGIAVPGPIAGAGLPALMALGGFVWARRRKAAVAA